MLGLFRPGPRRSRPAVEALEERSVPAVFTVTNKSDHNPGSLRVAVQNANARLGHDTIRFAPAFNATITLTTGDIDITDDLTIEGLGANRCVVSGNNASRIFDMHDAPGFIDVNISGLKLTRGSAAANTDDDGGAIDAGENTLTLNNCVISGNRTVNIGIDTANGGAVACDGGVVTAVNTIFANNGAADSGGAFYLTNDARLTATNCQFLNNTAIDGDGGAIASIGSEVRASNTVFASNSADDGGALLLTDNSAFTATNSRFSNNQAIDGDGGAFYGAGRATIQDCVISGNTGNEGGGLEWSGGNIVIERTTIRNNTGLYGGGLSVDGGTRLTIRDSTVAFNRTNGDGDSGGAGMLLDGVEALVVQCTVSGNVDQTSNPDADTGGGGIRIEGGRVVIRNSTIAFNSTTGRGGGLFVDGGANVQIVSTILSNSSAPAGDFDVARPAGDSLVKVLFSVIQRIQPGFINNGSTGNQLGVNPQLLPLANNGGPTLTHAITSVSPARNRGRNPDVLLFDQRGPGFPRVKDGKIDVGAYEV